MGYIDSGPDAHDVFVSYAHGPVPLNSGADGSTDLLTKWTSTLVRDLGQQIDIYIGIKEPAHRTHFWMDPELEGNLPLTANLRTKVEQSALMLVVMSNFYLDSEWCGKEVAWFTSAAPDHAGAGEVFVVRALPTDESRWPATLREERGATLPGYRFHPTTRPGEDCDPYGWSSNEESEYRKLILTLARDMTKQLRRTKWKIQRESRNGAGRFRDL